MDFSEALKLLKAGYKIRRENWNGKNQWLELGHNACYTDTHGKFCETDNPCIVFVTPRGTQVGWLASQPDMLSNDWIIMEV